MQPFSLQVPSTGRRTFGGVERISGASALREGCPSLLAWPSSVPQTEGVPSALPLPQQINFSSERNKAITVNTTPPRVAWVFLFIIPN